MRGFPVGSLVLSKKIETQKDKQCGYNQTQQELTTHHILDGQQRCYAIALGYSNPWYNASHKHAVLWLDINPGSLLNNSVRQYLFRVTTTAHPWGFDHGNKSSRLSVFNIRKSLEGVEKRPAPIDSKPFDAEFPIPVFLLLEHFDGESVNWESLSKADILTQMKGFDARKFDNLDDKVRTHINNGLRHVNRALIIALQVPDGTCDIENIEQIFQRLNRQGTPLDNEDLAYSMIKAYWPDVETYINKAPCHTTESRLVNMAIRVALADDSAKMPAEHSIDRIRNIFRPIPHKDYEREDAKEVSERESIEKYFKDDLAKSLKWIDDHLLYNPDRRSYGIPAYIRSSLAWNSRDVFAWLMVIAKHNNYTAIDDNKIVKTIIGIALAVHWFGLDKYRATGHLPVKDFTLMSLENIKDDKGNLLVHTPLAVRSLEDEAIRLDSNSSENQIEGWKNFWEGIVSRNDKGVKCSEDESTSRGKKYGVFTELLRKNRELLLYAQRNYIYLTFNNFDPSDRLMWKGHNRPWDYDHILPSNTLNATGRGEKAGRFHDACKTWQQSIGNLVAVDFSFNRQAQDTAAPTDKYGENVSNIVTLDGMFEEISKYDIGLDDTKDFKKSKEFILAAKNRFVKLYKDWY